LGKEHLQFMSIVLMVIQKSRALNACSKLSKKCLGGQTRCYF